MEGRAPRLCRAGTPDAPQAEVRERPTVRSGVSGAALFLSSEVIAGASRRQSLCSLAQSDFARSEIIDSGLYLQFATLDCVADNC
jgi:hypothetical protein